MDQVKVVNIAEVNARHKSEHPGYEYNKKVVIGKGEGGRTQIGVYELPPRKASYPYHYHEASEETFYILQGVGELRTPEGNERLL